MNPTPSQMPFVAPPPAPPKASGSSLLRGSLPRIVGYGLLALFAIDIAQAFVTYTPLSAESDSALVVQLVERVGVPLIAYALIFGTNTGGAERRERTVLKLLSIGALFALVVYLGLAALAVTSAYRLTTRGTFNIDRQAIERVSALEKAGKQVPTATDDQLFAIYRSIIVMKPDAPRPAREALVEFAAKRIPEVIKTTRENADLARATLTKQQTMFGVKYAAGGLLSAILFLLIWENTGSVRAHRIFTRNTGPSMAIEDKLVGGFQSLQTRMEDAFFLSSLEKYRWYRRLRRFFGGRH